MKKLITICLVVLMLSSTSVSWATPTVNPPPDAPRWWNVECDYYAYGWWEADIYFQISSDHAYPPPDADHWASNFLNHNNFQAWVEGTTVIIDLDNVYRENYYKEIYIYITGTNEPTTESIISYLDTDGGVFEGWYGGSIVGGNWTYMVSGEIDPQPSYVYLTVNVPGLTSVTNIWAGENCIPEPATVALLGLGGLLFSRNRKFNKKQK